MPVRKALQILILSAALSAVSAPAMAKDKSDQLDMHDEPPVGPSRYMRGKKHNYARTHPKGPMETIVDLGIIVTGSGLVGLVFFVIASRRRPVRPPVSD